MAKKTVAPSFLHYTPTDRPDIYQVAPSTWTSIVQINLFPSHLLSNEQATGLISNFRGLLNGTLAGDPNPSITLQFVLLKYPSSFSSLLESYNQRAETLANENRAGASNIAWSWYQYLSSIVSKDLYQRWGGIAITVRPIKSLFKKKTTEEIGEADAFQLLDDTVNRVVAVTNQIQWDGQRLEGDDLVAFLSFWAMGEMRRPNFENSDRLAWEV